MHHAHHSLGLGAVPTALLHVDEPALSSSLDFPDGVSLKWQALLGGLLSVNLLFVLLSGPWPAPPCPAPFVCFHSRGWLCLLLAEGKLQSALWSLFGFFPSSPETMLQTKQEKHEALARGSLCTHSTVEKSLLAGLGITGTISTFGP